MTAEFAHHAVYGFIRKLLNHKADIAQMRSGLDLRDAQTHAFIGDVAQSFGKNRRFANKEHPAGIAMVAVLDDGYVDIDHVAVLQDLVAGNAMADDVVDGGANCLRIRRIAWRTVIERRRDASLD